MENVIGSWDLHENFTTNVSLDKENSIKFWKSTGSGVRIRIPDPDHIRLGGGMRSPSALVTYILALVCIDSFTVLYWLAFPVRPARCWPDICVDWFIGRVLRARRRSRYVPRRPLCGSRDPRLCWSEISWHIGWLLFLTLSQRSQISDDDVTGLRTKCRMLEDGIKTLH